MLFFVLRALANQVGSLVGQLALVKLVNIYCAGGLQFGAFAGRRQLAQVLLGSDLGEYKCIVSWHLIFVVFRGLILLGLLHVFLQKVDAVKLAKLIDGVVAFELLDLALLLQGFELVNLYLEFAIVHVLRIPIRDLVVLKQMTKLHLL